jgi:hypothetical protein
MPNLKAIVTAILVSTPALALPSFNAVTDFSTLNGNPNGVWTYGAAADNHSNLAVVFTLHDETASFAEWTNGNPFFFPSDYPVIGKNLTNAPLVVGNSVFQTNELRMSPNDPNNVTDPIVVLRFMAPAAGFYTFTGSFQAEDDGTVDNGTQTEATINLNNALPQFTFEITANNGFLDPHPFSFGQSLNLGDTMDFRVNACQTGGTCGFFRASTGLTLSVIEGVPAGTPEPGSIVLAAGSLLAIAGVRFRRR